MQVPYLLVPEYCCYLMVHMVHADKYTAWNSQIFLVSLVEGFFSDNISAFLLAI